jgi:predicted nucleic acid-binding protein|tara:strand:- start:45 stop:467 length:423 start_codon:yes stop_codon:yes gene_type:complete
MDKILVDTNVVLDLLSERKGFIEETQIFFTLASQDKIKLFVSTLTFANAHYILSNQMKISGAQKILRKFKILVDCVSFDEKILELSLDSKFKDYEDSIQYYSALACSADLIVTRNKKDFKLSSLPVLDVKEYLTLKKADL